MKPELKEWLLKKHATPTEVKIYLHAAKAVKGDNIAFKNGDIAELHGTTRQNIRQNLARMIEKGLIKRNSFQTYVLAKTF
jgi:DNA-binding MarR family transcriptional regulator